MNAQLLYATKTGHSGKIANAIARQTGVPVFALEQFPETPSANGCCCGGVCAAQEDTPPPIPPCDILFIVSGIYAGQPKPALLNFVKTLNPEQIGRVVLLTSSLRGTAQRSLREVLTQGGHRVTLEEYLCRGSFLFMAMGHPNTDEVAGAVAFVKKQLAQTE